LLQDLYALLFGSVAGLLIAIGANAWINDRSCLPRSDRCARQRYDETIATLAATHSVHDQVRNLVSAWRDYVQKHDAILHTRTQLWVAGEALLIAGLGQTLDKSVPLLPLAIITLAWLLTFWWMWSLRTLRWRLHVFHGALAARDPVHAAWLNVFPIESSRAADIITKWLPMSFLVFWASALCMVSARMCWLRQWLPG